MFILDLSQSGSGGKTKTHIVTEAVTKDENGGKLGLFLRAPALNNGGTCYEGTKDERGRKENRFHLERDEKRKSVGVRGGGVVDEQRRLGCSAGGASRLL